MQTIIVDMTPGFRMPTIYYSQGDVGTQFAIDLRSRFGDSFPTGTTVTIQATKPSGFGFSVAATSVTNGVATFTTTAEMTDEFGRFPAELKVTKTGLTLFSANFYMNGEENTHPDGTIDGQQETVIPELAQLVERVEDAASSVLDMTVEAETLAAGSDATYSYDEETNTATFGIPKGADGSLASGVLAPTYSSSSTYAVGDYVYYSGSLYRCTTAITTAEAWTSGHWTQVALAPEVSDLKDDINEINNGRYAFALIPNKYILRDNGNEETYNGWSATDYIPCPPNTTLVIDTDGASLVWGAKYNSSKTYVSSYSWDNSNTSYTNKTDDYVYFRTSGANADMADVTATLLPLDTRNISLRIKSRDLTSIFSNNPVWFCEDADCKYFNGDTYRGRVVDTISLQTGKDYILYCGDMSVPTDSGRLMLYVVYTDSSVQRVTIMSGEKYCRFMLDASKTIQSCTVYAVSVNGTAVSGNGTAHFANMYIFEGVKLAFRSIINATDEATDIPSYYNSHLATQEATIRYHENNSSARGDSLVFLTDTHHSDDYAINDNKESNYANACHSVDLIKHIMANTGVRMICFGGDLVNSTVGIDDMIHSIHCYKAKYGDCQSRLVYCVGNHEYFTDLGQDEPDRPTAEWLYSSAKHQENIVLGVGAKGTYYFDNVPQQIRYFVIPCGRDTEVDSTQASWVMEEFAKVPTGYHIVLIGHAFMVDLMNGFRGQYKYILEAFDAVKAKSQYWYGGVTYDYRNLNNVIPVCAITGHTHIDGYLNTTGGIPCICTTCDSYRQNYEIQGGELVNVPRTKGTVDEQAFDVIQFDLTNRKIFCTRIGYGSDRQFTY